MFLLYGKSLPFGEVRWGDNSTDVHNIAPIAAESLAVNDADLLTLCFGRQACSEKRVPVPNRKTETLLLNIYRSEGIRVDKNSNLRVFANTFSMNTTGNFGRGIFVKGTTGGNIYLSNNVMTQYKFGVSLNTINSSTVTIQNMNLSNPNNLSSVSTGIRISGMTGPGAATIQSNVISETRVGIEAVNARINSSNNNITMPTGGLNGTGNYYGIRVSMGANSKVDHNTITRSTNPNNQATTKLFGISVETSANTTIASNNTTNMGTGLQCFGAMPGSTIKCNIFTTCRRGITLSSANVGNQGSSTAASDNQWTGTFNVSGDLFGIGTNFLSTWYVKSSTGFSPSNNGYIILSPGTGTSCP